jgi:excisionase family DNA binding protein
MERDGYSAREIERRYRIDRGKISVAIQRGELRAHRLGRRRFLILRADLERWLSGFVVKPGSPDDIGQR